MTDPASKNTAATNTAKRSLVKRVLPTLTKALLTVGAFYLLLNHSVDDGTGGTVKIYVAMAHHLKSLEIAVFLPYILLASAIKLIGIMCSMLRWHLLLKGQGIVFNFWHLAGAFLIGRFLGTFLPSTVGLDSYKLYDASRFSGKLVPVTAATVLEKVMGLGGIFLTFMVTLPFGYVILEDSLGALAGPTLIATVGISVTVLAGLFFTLLKPGAVNILVKLLPTFGKSKIEKFLTQVGDAATAYAGKSKILIATIGLSFMVHFTTAAMYFFTALAIGAMGAEFWQIAFASSIQIFATVLSPFTIAGEGIREIVHTLLLKDRIGATQAVMSAALGFWAAEAMTLVGAFFWWARKADYFPASLIVDGEIKTKGKAVSKSKGPLII